MRTTVTIQDDLLAEAKRLALTRGRPVGSVLEDGIRLLLSLEAEAPKRAVSLTTFGTGGLQPGVDLQDKDALYDLLDEGDEDA